MLAEDFLIDAAIAPALLQPRIAPSRAALAIIDVQEDFYSPHGAAGRWGIGVDTLVTVGFTTECCMDCTVRDAFHRDYRAFVVTDACAAYDESLHLGALAGLSKNCALLTDTDAVLAAWSGQGDPVA